MEVAGGRRLGDGAGECAPADWSREDKYLRRNIRIFIIIIIYYYIMMQLLHTRIGLTTCNYYSCYNSAIQLDSDLTRHE